MTKCCCCLVGVVGFFFFYLFNSKLLFFVILQPFSDMSFWPTCQSVKMSFTADCQFLHIPRPCGIKIKQLLFFFFGCCTCLAAILLLAVNLANVITTAFSCQRVKCRNANFNIVALFSDIFWQQQGMLLHSAFLMTAVAVAAVAAPAYSCWCLC